LNYDVFGALGVTKMRRCDGNVKVSFHADAENAINHKSFTCENAKPHKHEARLVIVRERYETLTLVS
jgi:hypothetical protein